jgi:ketosteroid isomerase-like protein
MPSETNKDEAQIRDLIGDWVKAMHDKNVDKLMSLYTPDILVFDLAPPLQHEGSATYRQNWEAWPDDLRGRGGGRSDRAQGDGQR